MKRPIARQGAGRQTAGHEVEVADEGNLHFFCLERACQRHATRRDRMCASRAGAITLVSSTRLSIHTAHEAGEQLAMRRRPIVRDLRSFCVTGFVTSCHKTWQTRACGLPFVSIGPVVHGDGGPFLRLADMGRQGKRARPAPRAGHKNSCDNGDSKTAGQTGCE